MILSRFTLQHWVNDTNLPCPLCTNTGSKVQKIVTLKGIDPLIQLHCDYDCGEYYIDLGRWVSYQDNYDPTPE